MLAMEEGVEVQVAADVTFWVVKSSNVPVAMNETLIPRGTELSAGAIAIDLRGDEVTSSAAGGALTGPSSALICVFPGRSPVAKPKPVMVATVVSDEPQVTTVERICLVVFEKVPVAVKGWVDAGAITAIGGVIAMAVRVASLTLRVAEPVTPPKWAVIPVDPFSTPVATPVLAMVAACGFDEDQIASRVKFWVVASLKVAVATNWTFVAGAMAGLAGVTDMN